MEPNNLLTVVVLSDDGITGYKLKIWWYDLACHKKQE